MHGRKQRCLTGCCNPEKKAKACPIIHWITPELKTLKKKKRKTDGHVIFSVFQKTEKKKLASTLICNDSSKHRLIVSRPARGAFPLRSEYPGHIPPTLASSLKTTDPGHLHTHRHKKTQTRHVPQQQTEQIESSTPKCFFFFFFQKALLQYSASLNLDNFMRNRCKKRKKPTSLVFPYGVGYWLAGDTETLQSSPALTV